MRKFLIAAVLLLAAPFAMAQGTEGAVEITPTVGYWFGDTLVRGTTGAFDFDVKIDDAPAFGMRLGYRFSQNWGFEAFLAHSRADLVTGQDVLFGGTSKVGTIDLTTAELGLEGSFGHSRMVPFIAGALGGMRLDPNIATASADNRFVASFGGGFKLFFTPQVALRFDARWHNVNVRSNTGGGCDYWHEWDCRNTDWITFTELGLGLTFAIK